MAILSTTEVKTYLGIIESTEYDNLIAAYLPMVIEEFFNETNNWFDNNAVRLYTSQITASSSDRTLVVTGTNFSTYSFQSGDEIRIRGSVRNDGFYTATTVSSATITVASSSVSVATFTLKNESEGEGIWTINKIDVPKTIKSLMTSMIKYKLDYPYGHPQSERLGDYSVTYGDGGYPEAIQKSINKYRLVKFI
jgi:hypothetical protein